MNTEKIKSFDEITENFFESYVPVEADNTPDNATTETSDEFDLAMNAISDIAEERKIIIQSDTQSDAKKCEKRSALKFIILLIFIFLFVASLVFVAFLYFKIDLGAIYERVSDVITSYLNNISR